MRNSEFGAGISSDNRARANARANPDANANANSNSNANANSNSNSNASPSPASSTILRSDGSSLQRDGHFVHGRFRGQSCLVHA
jgi:hypothetical protein